MLKSLTQLQRLPSHLLTRAVLSRPLHSTQIIRPLSITTTLRQNPPHPLPGDPNDHSDPLAHRNFYRTHGRALLKALTLAFLSYQIFYWAWLTLETEETKRLKEGEIEGLENQLRMLDERRKEDGQGGSAK